MHRNADGYCSAHKAVECTSKMPAKPSIQRASRRSSITNMKCTIAHKELGLEFQVGEPVLLRLHERVRLLQASENCSKKHAMQLLMEVRGRLISAV
jgi:hypothetical protein